MITEKREEHLLSATEAKQRILEHAEPLKPVRVSLENALDRALAESITASHPLPPFDNSAMDGYAVRSEDIKDASPGRPVRLRTAESLPAGVVSQRLLERGEAARIMTGAALPPGADAVVMQERAQTDGHTVLFTAPVEPGENVRRRGEDVSEESAVLEIGTPIGPVQTALLAALGRPEVLVTPPPAVSVLATGDELLEAAVPLSPGRIHNANSPALIAALKRLRIPCRDLGIARDSVADLTARISEGLQSDLLLLSGGVSVGEWDLCRRVLESLGVQIVFWRIAIRPGKPLLFGTLQGKLIFGLPGNPISALVCFEEFVRIALWKMMGRQPPEERFYLGALEADLWKPPDRRCYLFARVMTEHAAFHVHIFRPQGSALLTPAARANALVVIPEGLRSIKKGETVLFRWFS